MKQRSTLRSDELDYDLPPGLIATQPVEPRDSARMLVMRRSEPERPLEHRIVRDLPEYLAAGDALVFNNTAVLPARFFGERRATHGRVEGLFIEEVEQLNGPAWRVMLKSGGRLRWGDAIEIHDRAGHRAGLTLTLMEKEQATWIVQASPAGEARRMLHEVGVTPLPPYILKARGDRQYEDKADRAWYQTVFADLERQKSVAAPTAGLHFTPGLLDAVAAKGVERVDLTLDVGPGTFKPVTAEMLADHAMHAERFEVSAEAIRQIQRVRTRQGRVIAVGTTSARTLESLPPLDEAASAAEKYGFLHGMTDLMIAPPHRFSLVDGMLTNFHLPRSTLLALVAALVGLDRLKAAYRGAIERRYRFYSYGDAMLILP